MARPHTDGDPGREAKLLDEVSVLNTFPRNVPSDFVGNAGAHVAGVTALINVWATPPAPGRRGGRGRRAKGGLPGAHDGRRDEA